MNFRYSILILALGSMHSRVFAAPVPPPYGKTQFEFVDQKGDPTRPVTVWMFVPETCDNKCPLQFVKHGGNRNGEEYLDNWVEFAKARYGFAAESYRMFGHSAGGQFVHRLHLFNPNHRADPIVAANPGWYMLPQWGIGATAYRFPYNTIGSRVDATIARQALSRPFVLMLGDRDTDGNDASLNKSAGANDQGRNRLARGEYFYGTAIIAAKDLGATLSWQRKYVAGVGHDNAGMAKAAIALMYPVEQKQ